MRQISPPIVRLHTRIAHLRVTNTSSIKKVQEIQEREPRHDMPVNPPHKLLLINTRGIDFRAIDVPGDFLNLDGFQVLLIFAAGGVGRHLESGTGRRDIEDKVPGVQPVLPAVNIVESCALPT